MSPFDAALPTAPSTTSEKAAAAPLSVSQIASLVKTVTQALARGQSVVVMSEGRMLARYLPPPESIELQVGPKSRKPRRKK